MKEALDRQTRKFIEEFELPALRGKEADRQPLMGAAQAPEAAPSGAVGFRIKSVEIATDNGRLSLGERVARIEGAMSIGDYHAPPAHGAPGA